MFVNRKGKKFERRWAEMLRESDCDRTAKRNLEEVRQTSIDIETELPFGYQVRSGHNVSIWKCLEDAQSGSVVADKRWPCGVVFATRNRKQRKGNPPYPPFIVMSLKNFVEWFEEIPAWDRPLFTAIEQTERAPAAKKLIRESEKRSKPYNENLVEIFLLSLEDRPEVVILSARVYLLLLRRWVIQSRRKGKCRKMKRQSRGSKNRS